MRKLSVDKSINDILTRSMAEKLLAVEEIWENIRMEALAENPSDEEAAFVRERLVEYERNPGKIKNWSTIKRNYQKKK